ncbi:MAG TPA: Stp1/IreP family PP2C-type Ser/Thr phosphatase, partial [Pyrinomonadaceae bacterium]
MSETRTRPTLEAAAVTDRGLNEKRPHNEDSYLLDAERAVFVVADGVGGANAGEVASRTAVEVLEEAFRHIKPGEDVEDLMEIAIQRANASIFQMSREQTQLSSMATTVVALHVDGRTATVGHVGDSRLYSLPPGGPLKRETEDHSVVEEEVKAGRMTREQAANHPSRNVISRALGAEQSVEVDLRTFEVEDGTTFLLCSDGITRHIPDREIESLLAGAASLEAACAEMKRLCFERGAEDNLTAVAVRVGARPAGRGDGARAAGDEDPTI